MERRWIGCPSFGGASPIKSGTGSFHIGGGRHSHQRRARIEGRDTVSLRVFSKKTGLSPRVDPDQSRGFGSGYALIAEILDEDVPCQTSLKTRPILRSAIPSR